MVRGLLAGLGAPWRLPVGALLAATLAGMALLGAPSPAAADGVTATPQVVVQETQDGQPVFDPTAGPGNDTGPNNAIVRTSDLVNYSVTMSINDPTAPSQTTFQNATATFAPLPLGFVWNALPLDCSGPNSKLTGDGVTTPSVLVCDFGAKTSGTTWNFKPAIKVLRTATSGTPLAPSATLSATGMVKTAVSAAPNVTVSVSQAPKVGVTITRPVNPNSDSDVINGVTQNVYYFPVGLHVDAGSDVINGDSFSFTADLSSLPAGATFQGCSNVYGGDLPWSTMSTTAGGAVNGVPTGSGTWTCTPDASNPKLIHITVKGVNTDPATCPTQGAFGAAIPSGQCYVATQRLKIDIPTSTLPASGAAGTIWVSNLTAVDTVGNPNYGGANDPGTGMTNNDVASSPYLAGRQHGWTSTFTGPSGASLFPIVKADYRYRDTFNGKAGTFTSDSAPNSLCCTTLPASDWAVGSAANSGDGYVSQTGVYSAAVRTNYAGLADLPAGYVQCMTIDNKNATITPLNSAMPTRGAFVQTSASLAGAGWVVQYGTGGNGGVNSGDGTGWADVAAQQAGSCNTSDSPAWYTDLSQVPGGAGAVTKVRAISSNTITVAQQTACTQTTGQVCFGSLWVALQVRSTTASGTIVPNYGWWANHPGTPGPTVTSSYNSATAQGLYGDRITVTGVRTTISKTASVQQTLAGQNVTFTLKPVTDALGSANPYQALNLTITDTLPVGETYVPGSSTCPGACEPVSVTVNPDGTTTVVWSLGSPLAGNAITPITYKATIGSLVADGTSLVNTAVISASNDGSPATYRTATATVSVVNSASFAVEKTLVNPLTEPGAQKVFNLKFQNLSNNTYPGTDFIDWLPFNGDQRTPASNFHGSVTLAGPAVDAAGAQTVTFTYTSFPTNQLNMNTDEDPATANPAIVWCTTAQFGAPGCPANYAAVTGIRINGGQILAQQSNTVRITLNATGDLNGDVFSNQSTGEISGLGLPIQSNTATGSTVLGSIAGTVWDDTAAAATGTPDGVLGSGEPNLSGVTVELRNAAGSVIATTTTDTNGHYVFPDLFHGDYSVHVVSPAGYSTTTPLVGSDPAVNSKIAYGTNNTGTITLTVGQNNLIQHAGFFKTAPAIAIEKDLNGAHVPDPNNPLLVATGSTMNVTFKVTNTGNTPLGPVTVTDDTVTNITCPATSLAPAESMDCTGTTPAPATPGATHTNHAKSVGSPLGLDGTPLVDANGVKAADVTATDEAHAYTPDPRISVVKTINNDDASQSAPGALVPNNQPMNITFTLKNEGNVALTNVGVTDDVVPASGIVCPQATLAIGESITCTATFPAPDPQVQHTDTATAKGTPPVLPDGTVLPDVTATALAFAHTAAHPAVSIVKTINGSTASHTTPGVGVVADSTMQITFEVTNSGDVRLEPVAVTDSVATAPIVCPATGLDPGETTTCTTTTDGPASGADHQDTATAKGTAATPAGNPLIDLGSGNPVGDVTGTSDAFAHALTPGIGLVKKINGIIAGDQDHAVLVPAGSVMAVTFEITNTGETDLDQITLTDDIATGLSCPATTLAAGKTMTCTATAIAPASGGFHHNTGTVTGQPLGPDGDAQGGTITTTAEAWAHTPAPNVAIVKKINGQDANSAVTAVKTSVGELMTVTFEVTNTGDVTLDPVTVTDDTIDAKSISCPAAVLAPGASVTCTATYPAPAAGALHTNTATVTATPPAYWDGTTEPAVISTDEANAYTDGHPAIALVKTINGEDANTAPGVLVKPGAAMKVVFTATNTGDVPLDSITVTDEPAAEITCPKAATLKPGASVTCTATITAPAAGGAHADTGTVTARPLDPAGNPLTDPTTGVTAGNVSATDPANAHAGAPTLTLTKTVCQTPAQDGADCGTWVPETRFLAGSTALWQIMVTNTGDTPLTGVMITDKIEPSCQVPANTTLDPSKTLTITCSTANVTAAELINTATATGTPSYPKGVTGDPVTTDPASAKVTTYAPHTPEATLAYTGTIIERLLPWAAGIIGAGLLILMATRRRRSAETTAQTDG